MRVWRTIQHTHTCAFDQAGVTYRGKCSSVKGRINRTENCSASGIADTSRRIQRRTHSLYTSIGAQPGAAYNRPCKQLSDAIEFIEE